jgi:hypothetical protein
LVNNRKPEHFPESGKMKKVGVSHESMMLRRHLLAHNADEIIGKMRVSGLAAPVGIIIDTTDEIGKALVYAILESRGMSKHEIPEHLVKFTKNESTPTFLCVCDLESARKVLPATSETALQNLSTPIPEGRALVVVIGGGGNSYAMVPIS